MNTEQLRAEFEAWWKDRQPAVSIKEDAFAAYQAGRAALQSQQQDSLVALKQMQRYFGKWPEFVPADEHQHNAIVAIKTMDDALAGVALQSRHLTVDALAQEIRRVNGDHSLGAGALAEALMPFLQSTRQSQDSEDAERYRYLRDSAQLFSHFGDTGNSGWCVMRRDHTIRRVFTYNGPELDAAIDHARRVEGEQ